MTNAMQIRLQRYYENWHKGFVARNHRTPTLAEVKKMEELLTTRVRREMVA